MNQPGSAPYSQADSEPCSANESCADDEERVRVFLKDRVAPGEDIERRPIGHAAKIPETIVLELSKVTALCRACLV